MIKKMYKGVIFYANSEIEINKKIDRYIFENSIFYRSAVYTYSCIARLTENNSVEFVEYFNNGKKIKVSYFKNKDDFFYKTSQH